MASEPADIPIKGKKPEQQNANLAKEVGRMTDTIESITRQPGTAGEQWHITFK